MVDPGPHPHVPGSLPAAPLSRGQLDRIRALGSVQEVRAGSVLFAAGDPSYDLFVLLDGVAQVVDRRLGAGEVVLAAYGSREFLGEIGMLLSEPARFTAVMAADGSVLRIPLPQVQALMANDVELSDVLLHAFLLRRAALVRRGVGVTLVGSRYDARTRLLTKFFARSRTAVNWIDLEVHREAEAVLARLEVPVGDLPIVLVPGRPMMRNPSRAELAGALGLGTPPDTPQRSVCDLLVIGGGPAGLAAAVYGASEGLDTILIDAGAFGGQAGTSSRIENYLGFPAGLSGAELTTRAVLQAGKFGAVLRNNVRATSLTSHPDVHEVTCDDGSAIAAANVIIATGADYRELPLADGKQWEGSGVYYAATFAEARFCEDQPVAVIGGANSAGQAAMFLARTAREVHLLVRGDDLEHSMSRYLIDAVASEPRITVHLRTEAVEAAGEGAISQLRIAERGSGERDAGERDAGDQRWLPVCAVFVFIGAAPCTDWLDDQLARDRSGFLLTGRDLEHLPAESRAPFPYETSRPGVFAIGDVRGASVKRVAAAVGEGSAAVRMVFEQRQADRAEL
ncbi:FAD-dependent oxidoreductase [Catenulispora rubra]|uniref:FAD-dependent oxidoreductase n=1 Tax=Catenulispora rubra TaxID=280293 RepID=UPI0018926F62|nr:cyclic nucleotide-binding domain-containing thioredoxin-disulfide reductase [Catenulispora rubra]